MDGYLIMHARYAVRVIAYPRVFSRVLLAVLLPVMLSACSLNDNITFEPHFVTMGEQGRLAFWSPCLASRCPIDQGAPLNYAARDGGILYRLAVDDAAQDGRELPELSFASSDSSIFEVVSAACNPRCVTDPRSGFCTGGQVECTANYGYLLRLSFVSVGTSDLEARTASGTLYDQAVFRVTAPQTE